jgi:Undecaprenyl-phosphate glucose phosphotransferase
MLQNADIHHHVPAVPRRSFWSRLFFYVAPPGALAVVDFGIVVVASVAAGLAYSVFSPSDSYDFNRFASYGMAVAILFVSALNLRGLYRPASALSLSEHLKPVLLMWCGIFAWLACMAFLLKVGDVFSRGATVLFFAIGGTGLVAWRLALKSAFRRMIDTGFISGPRVALLVDEGRQDGGALTESLKKSGYVISRRFVVGADFESAESKAEAFAVVQSLIAHVRKANVDEIIVVFRSSSSQAMHDTLETLKMVPHPVKLLPDPDLAWFLSRKTCEIGPSRAVVLQQAPLSTLERATKRTCDIIASAGALLMLSPLLAIVAVAISLDTSGPVLFRQWRGGYNGRKFQIFKFRTMTVEENGPHVRQAQRNDKRVTRVGRILRKYSIDELPQLINVLRGEMSLVGPRPHALAHDTSYSQLIAPYPARHNVKPGITGWAQINGCRGETAEVEAMKRRVELDLGYIQNWSLLLDARILLMTVREVVSPKNAF